MIDFPGILKDARRCFLDLETSRAQGVKVYEVFLPGARAGERVRIKIFGISQGQTLDDCLTFKSELLAELNLSAPVVTQYVGLQKSNTYSVAGTQKIESWIEADLQSLERPRVAIYSAVGKHYFDHQTKGERANLSGCMNRVLERLGTTVSHQVFAAVVDQSIALMESNQNSFSQQVRNIIYVYGRENNKTRLGDEAIYLNVMTDELKDFSGEPRALLQTLDVIRCGGQVSSFSGLRTAAGEQKFNSTAFFQALAQTMKDYSAQQMSQGELEAFETQHCEAKGIERSLTLGQKQKDLNFAFRRLADIGAQQVLDHVRLVPPPAVKLSVVYSDLIPLNQKSVTYQASDLFCCCFYGKQHLLTIAEEDANLRKNSKLNVQKKIVSFRFSPQANPSQSDVQGEVTFFKEDLEQAFTQVSVTQSRLGKNMQEARVYLSKVYEFKNWTRFSPDCFTWARSWLTCQNQAREQSVELFFNHKKELTRIKITEQHNGYRVLFEANELLICSQPKHRRVLKP